MPFVTRTIQMVFALFIKGITRCLCNWITDLGKSYGELCDYAAMDSVSESLQGDSIYSQQNRIYKSVQLAGKTIVKLKTSSLSWPKVQLNPKRLAVQIRDRLIKNRIILAHTLDSRSSFRLLSCFRLHCDPDCHTDFVNPCNAVNTVSSDKTNSSLSVFSLVIPRYSSLHKELYPCKPKACTFFPSFLNWGHTCV